MKEMVIARLNDRCQPLERGDIYEDPLEDALETAGFGELLGGGSSFSRETGIEFVDLELALKGDIEAAVALVVETLESLGAPKGSKVIRESGAELTFGRAEGAAFYFNIVEVPEDVQERFPLQPIAEEFVSKLAGIAEARGAWANEQWVAMYFFGPSYDEIAAVLAPYVAEHPRCAGARLERIA